MDADAREATGRLSAALAAAGAVALTLLYPGQPGATFAACAVLCAMAAPALSLPLGAQIEV